MILPIRHENMSARRWPVVTIALIVINVAAFVGTKDTMQQQSHQLSQVKAHLLMLAAMHPELKVPADAQDFVNGFRDKNAKTWAQIQKQDREIADGWDAKVRLMDEAEPLQAEMDSLGKEYADLASSSLTEQYAFVPSHPKPLAYITANFLHGSWLHLIGNMWFLWLAGFVLEDTWGRPLYTLIYFLAGAAALQFHAWLNAGSIIPTLGASGAVAALMGAFLVRFPKMKIDMIWLFSFRIYRFKAPAYALLPLWLAMEVFYGSLFGQMSGVAHWAHVGGFLFGCVAAMGLRYSGLEKKANQAIEQEVTWQNDPEIVQATEMIEKGQLDEATAVLQNYLAAKPDSIDGMTMLQQVHWRKQDIPAYHETTLKLCGLHMAARQADAAWQNYEEFLNSGGKNMPAGPWLEICRAAEQRQDFERAAKEYEGLAAAYPKERQSLQAQLGAAKLYLNKLNRPMDALRMYEAAAASPVPHLDWEQNIEAGIRETKAAMTPAAAAARV